MTKIKITTLALVLFQFACSSLSAQQDPMFSQYMFNTLSINPAFAGSAGITTLNGIYRHQWTQIDGAPVTQSITGHGKLLSQNIGVGGTILNDKIGPIRQTGVYADASYIMDLGNSKFAFGIKGGVNFFQADLLDLNPSEEGDPVFGANISNKALPNFGGGIMWYSPKHILGFSVPKILSNELISGELPSFENNKERQHFFFIAGYVADVTHYMKFKPTLLVKAVEGAPLGIDISANFLFYERLWIGAMYRKTDAVGLLLQYEVNRKVKVGYAYDYVISEIGKYSNGSHEVMISFDFLKKVSGDISPRYFN